MTVSVNHQILSCLYTEIPQLALGFIAKPLPTLIHEAGHAIAAQLFYKNAKPRIVLIKYGYNGGYCRYNARSLSKLGRLAGKHNSEAMVSAAGPVAELIAALALSYFYPGNGISTITIHYNTDYALSTFQQKAFFTNTPSNFYAKHDFVQIKVAKGVLAATLLILISLAVEIFSIYLRFQTNGWRDI
jgi:hypothetical protein